MSDKIVDTVVDPVHEDDKKAKVHVITGNEAFNEAMIKEPQRAWSQAMIFVYAFSAVGFFCSTMNGNDGSLIKILLQNKWFKEKYVLDNDDRWAGIVSSMYQIGGIVALPFVGPSIDGLGRRLGMFIGTLTIIVGTIIQGTSHGMSPFMGGRFLPGFGVSIAASAGPMYVVEINLRSVALSVPFKIPFGNADLSYFLGSVLDTAGYTDMITQANITLINSCQQFFFAILGACLVDRIGRQPLLLFSFTGCTVVWLGMTIACSIFAMSYAGDDADDDPIYTNHHASKAALAMIFIFGFIYLAIPETKGRTLNGFWLVGAGLLPGTSQFYLKMPIEVSDRFRVVGFGAWGLLYGTLLIAESPLAEQKLWVFIPSTLVSLSLVAFVFFKMAHYFPATSEASKKWHDFFYTERRGAMALLALCIIWCFDVICTLINTFEDLVSSGAIEKVLAKLNSQGIFGMIMSDGLKIFIVFYSLFLLSWIFWAGVKAFWRIRAPVHRESDHEAGLGLVSRQSD